MNIKTLAKNQFVVETEKGKYFQSYDSVIAFIPNDGSPIQLGSKWDFSNTTRTYRNEFLHTTKKSILEKLKSGEFILNPNLSIQ